MRFFSVCGWAAMGLLLLSNEAVARPHREARPRIKAESAPKASERPAEVPSPVTEPTAVAEPVAPRGVDPYASEPPPSTYDLTQRGLAAPEARPEDLNFAAENRSLVAQLLRTLAALAGVLALIYLSARLLLPRLKMGKHGKSASMEVLERLNLDGRNALIIMGTKAGGRFVLGCSDAGVQLLERTPANGAYVPDADGILRPQPGASSFGDFLGAEPKSSPDTGRGP